MFIYLDIIEMYKCMIKAMSKIVIIVKLMVEIQIGCLLSHN